MSQLPVLIVGAGPTGLMMANELARHRISFRIIDQSLERTQGSNATWIQTRTLEMLDAIGIIEPFLKNGHKCKAIHFYFEGKCLANMSLTTIDSTYPFILMLPQRETERILNEKLEEFKIHVERPLKLMDIKQTNDGIISTIRLSNGNIETITSHWVVACDGANSTIREKCKISFPGEDIREQFMVADAEMDSFLPIDAMHVFFDKGTIFPEKATIFSAFPWGSNLYRLSANLYHEAPRQTFHEHEVKKIVAERTYGNFIVEKVSWVSPFWIHSRVVDNLKNNAIFLLGDAAHIHSPAGGQGMNTGLQDAYNLAWKLALVINNKAKTSLLDSYQMERYPVVNKIVEKTNRLTNMMLFDKNFFKKFHKFCKDLMQENTAKKLAAELMQIDIHYRNSSIIDYHEKPFTKSLQQGSRAPDVMYDKPKNLYQHFCNTSHNILLFSGINPKKTNLNKIVKLQIKLNQQFTGVVNTHLISTVNLNEDQVIFDINQSIHQQYHVKNAAIYVVRPDTYIGYFSKKLDLELLVRYLKNIFI